ncbi:hypothetical protein REPUB_Repub03eG0259400 [Reevesia pubescens]
MASNSEIGSGTPVYTQLQLRNHSDDYIKLNSYNYWHGSGQAPKTIEAQQPGNFQVSADPAGSIGAVVYDFPTGKIKWIVAWSNPEGASNKAYTDIVKECITIDWDDIKTKLDKSGNQSSVKNVEGYSAEVVIDPNSSTPNFTGTLKPAA